MIDDIIAADDAAHGEVDDTPWPPEAYEPPAPAVQGRTVRFDTRGFPHLVDGEMDEPVRWTDTR